MITNMLTSIGVLALAIALLAAFIPCITEPYHELPFYIVVYLSVAIFFISGCLLLVTQKKTYYESEYDIAAYAEDYNIEPKVIYFSTSSNKSSYLKIEKLFGVTTQEYVIIRNEDPLKDYKK